MVFHDLLLLPLLLLLILMLLDPPLPSPLKSPYREVSYSPPGRLLSDHSHTNIPGLKGVVKSEASDV